MKIKHKLEKGVLCYFHKQHTDNIISVSLETGGYAILRKKIDKEGMKKLIYTVSGRGYKIDEA